LDEHEIEPLFFNLSPVNWQTNGLRFLRAEALLAAVNSDGGNAGRLVGMKGVSKADAVPAFLFSPNSRP
jgi:hypothetical protein